MFDGNDAENIKQKEQYIWSPTLPSNVQEMIIVIVLFEHFISCLRFMFCACHHLSTEEISSICLFPHRLVGANYCSTHRPQNIFLSVAWVALLGSKRKKKKNIINFKSNWNREKIRNDVDDVVQLKREQSTNTQTRCALSKTIQRTDCRWNAVRSHTRRSCRITFCRVTLSGSELSIWQKQWERKNKRENYRLLMR